MADDFLAIYTPLANDIATRTGVDPSVVLGIIDTETGGGKHVLGNNIFGITPPGGVARYPDVQTAANAFVTLMQTPRYRGVAAVADPASQAAALVKGGYNTVNPQYASIVANKALGFGKQLGYQDKSGGGTEEGPAVYSTSAQPAATADQIATTGESDSFFPPGTAPQQQPAQPPATTGSAKDRVLSDPALGGTSSAAPAAGSSAKDRVLTDPALKTTETTTTTQEKPAGTSLADVITSPEAVAADRPAGETPPSQSAIVNALQPAPNTTYGDLPWVWGARDDKTGAIRFAMPNALRQPLLDIFQGTVGAQTTVDPDTGQVQYGMTPGANALQGFGVRGLRFSGPRPLEFVPPGTLEKAPLPPDAAANLLSPDARVRAAETPPGPTTPTGIEPPPPAPIVSSTEGGVQPAGAQVTPGYEAIHTPAEEAAYRATAEGKKLLEPQIIGERDVNQYIPGETVNNAEREQTVKTARELKELGIRVPEASQMDKAAAESNNTARTIYLDNTTKGQVEITNRRTQRQTDIEADKAKVFAPDNVTGPVDLKPVIDHMEAVLDQPFNRQNTALQQAYRPWLERMKAIPDGIIKDPEEAWGLRYDIDQQTDKFAQRDNSNMHRVAHQLGGAADAIDSQIEKVAPGYADMLARYKEHSRAIDEMEVLQGAKDKFRGPGQKLTYNDFQRYIKNVVDSRMTPSTDLNAFKAISDENMQRLWNIRDSLRRTASAQELMKAAGSDTMPNIIDALKAVGKMGGTAALHAYVGAHLGPGGNLALQSLGQIGRALNERRGIRRGMQQMENLLRPSEPLRVPPGQESWAPPPP